jgi:hypothetical protein
MIDLQYDSAPALVTSVTVQKIFAMGAKQAIIVQRCHRDTPGAVPLTRACTCDRTLPESADEGAYVSAPQQRVKSSAAVNGKKTNTLASGR